MTRFNRFRLTRSDRHLWRLAWPCVLLTLLGRVGIVSSQQLSEWRKYAVVGIAFAAMLLTLLPRMPARRGPSTPLHFRDALTAPLLKLDLYIFLLHAMMTAMFTALPFVLSDRLQLPLLLAHQRRCSSW